MLSPRKSEPEIQNVFEKMPHGGLPIKAQLHPGERVEVLDMCGRPTGIVCTVQKAEKHSAGVVWGGELVTVGRLWLRKVS
jgi:hypothetical protein